MEDAHQLKRALLLLWAEGRRVMPVARGLLLGGSLGALLPNAARGQAPWTALTSA